MKLLFGILALYPCYALGAEGSASAQWLQLSREHLEAGLLAKPEQEKKAHFQKGKELASKARDSGDTSAEATLLWIGNSGELAGIEQNLSSLFVVKNLESELKRLVETDPNIQYAAPFRALGFIYMRAPRFFSVGNLSKADSNIAEAVKRFPKWPENKMAAAELFIEQKKLAAAKEAMSELTDDFLSDASSNENQILIWKRDREILASKLEKAEGR